MRRIVFLILVTVLSVHSLKAQKEKDNVTVLKTDRLAKSGNGNLLTLEGNVSISTQKLTISKADKVVYDEALKKLVICGATEYSFDGKVNAASPYAKITRVEYMIGDDTLYIK